MPSTPFDPTEPPALILARASDPSKPWIVCGDHDCDAGWTNCDEVDAAEARGEKMMEDGGGFSHHSLDSLARVERRVCDAGRDVAYAYHLTEAMGHEPLDRATSIFAAGLADCICATVPQRTAAPLALFAAHPALHSQLTNHQWNNLVLFTPSRRTSRTRISLSISRRSANPLRNSPSRW